MATLTSSFEKNALLNAYFKHNSYDRVVTHPIYRGLILTVVAINWEGTPNSLADAFEISPSDNDAYCKTLINLGYEVESEQVSIANMNEFSWEGVGLFQSADKTMIATKIDCGVVEGYDHINDTQIELSIESEFQISFPTKFSQIFRESAQGGAPVRAWMKRTTAPYISNFKELLLISLMINLLGALNPFFIMSVYQFALPAASVSNLAWIVVGALLVVIGEYYFKRKRSEKFEEAGSEISNYISHSVIAKLIWLPYSRTSTATEGAQIARIRDIDNIRKTLTSESTQAWFDLPFVIIFILAIVALAGTTALIVIAGVIIMIIFATIAKTIAALAATQSSIAATKVQQQWHETLAALNSIQGLPLESIVKLRFATALEQSENDGVKSRLLNSTIMNIGGSLSQLIGTACIIFAAYLVMQGDIDFGAMLAVVMLVWKCITPFVGIYNSINRLKQTSSSSAQVDALMQIPDERIDLNKSTPLYRIEADLNVKDLTVRVPGTDFMLRQLNFSTASGQWMCVSGPSGCGKTTLINVLTRIIDNYQGTVLIDQMSIKQFNSFNYRKLVKSKPQDIAFFELSLRENFAMYCGYFDDSYLRSYLQHMKVDGFLEDSIHTIMTPELVNELPGDVIEVLLACLTIGSADHGLLLLDEPLPGVELIYQQRFLTWLKDHFSVATIVFFSNETPIISACSNVLLLDQEGGQKYLGSVDKVLENLKTVI